MLRLKINTCPELVYTAQVLLNEFLGLSVSFELSDDIIDIELFLENGKKITFKDSFFSKFNFSKEYLCSEAIPKNVSWLKDSPYSEKKPVIFGLPKIDISDDSVICKVDIFASAFFMLSRWEEAVCDKKDVHNRFSAKESLAYKEGFFNRPVVNEYVEIIWNMLKHLGYDGQRKAREFKIEVSHDVDAPFKYVFMSFPKALKMFAGDIIKRKDPVSAFKNISNYFAVKRGNIGKDPFNTFDFIMNISERYGLKSIFFFISDKGNGKYDGLYEINDEKIVALMKKINKRGHRIGLHGSYDSYSSDKIGVEFNKLRKVCKESDINQEINSSRQHFLRWKTPETFQYLENAGVKYDSTLTYAEVPGFRTGSCYEFPVFNVKTRKQLRLIERPLVVMEASLLANKYMNLSISKAKEKALELKKECVKYDGTFSVLWHNNEFSDCEKRELYINILEGK